MNMRQLQVSLIDPFGVVAEQRVFDLKVPIGGSTDDATDDMSGGEQVAEFVGKYAGAMAGGGLAFTVKSEYIDDGPSRGVKR